MSVISPIILLIGLSNVTGTQYLLPIKRQREFTISVICGAIINFILNLCLIWKYGAIGASIGTVVAELTVTFVQMYFVRRDFKLKEVFKLSKNYFVSSLIMFIACLVIGKFINNDLISTVVQVAVGGITYGICLLIMKDKFIFDMLNKLINKVRKI